MVGNLDLNFVIDKQRFITQLNDSNTSNSNSNMKAKQIKGTIIHNGRKSNLDNISQMYLNMNETYDFVNELTRICKQNIE